MIDLHCHLDLYDDPAAVVTECERRGLYVLSVTTTPSAFEGTQQLAANSRRIRTALGLHPELVARRAGEMNLFETLLPMTDYVGEVGLDGSAPHRASLDLQREVFTKILRLCAAAGGRKLTIHSRGATGAVLDALEQNPKAGTFVLHWYLGSSRQMERAVRLGAWFSVGPAMLTSARGLATAALMPQDRVLPESDGPFGTVEGRSADPWDAWRVVSPLASLWNLSVSDTQTRLMANFRNFSDLA